MLQVGARLSDVRCRIYPLPHKLAPLVTMTCSVPIMPLETGEKGPGMIELYGGCILGNGSGAGGVNELHSFKIVASI